MTKKFLSVTTHEEVIVWTLEAPVFSDYTRFSYPDVILCYSNGA